MIGSLSSSYATASVEQNSALKTVPSSPTNGTASNGDIVQLSDETQKHLADAKTSSATAPPSMSQIIKEAADGDISALAKLALIA